MNARNVPLKNATERATKRATKRATMLSLYRSGKTMTEIGAQFGISRQAVKYWLRGHFSGRGGVHKRHDDRKAEMVRLFRAGRSWIEIAQATKLSPATVANYLFIAGLRWKDR